MITIEDRQPFDLGPDITVTPVLQSVPIWDDCAFIIQTPTETILDLNDLKIPAVDLAWVARNFDIDCLMMQFSGANWHPHVYDYPPAKKRALARRKILTKYRHVADVVARARAGDVVPCAGPPCFLDDELFELNFSEHSIFPGADDFYRFARVGGLRRAGAHPHAGRRAPLGTAGPGADRGQPRPAAVLRQAGIPRGVPRAPPSRTCRTNWRRSPSPEAPLLERFIDYFRPLVLANPYVAGRIGGGFLIESSGDDPEQIFVDFGDRTGSRPPLRR